METDSSLSAADAAAALDQVQAGRAAAARRIPTPWWFHPLLGLALAVMLGAFSLPQPASTVVVGASLLAQLLLYWLYRRLTGVWLNLLKVPSMRRPTLLAGVVAYGLFGAGALLELMGGVTGGFAMAGAVLGVAYVAYWRWAERELARTWLAAR